MKKYLITATGTEIGKTAITCAIIHILREKNHNVTALKPVISGWEDDNSSMDTIKILESLGKKITNKSIESISPWRFKAPLSPHIAAKREEREIDFNTLVNFCREDYESDYIFIEGAGGIMTPLTDNKSFLDLAKALEIPTILITGSYLGSISHTLTATEAMQKNNIIISHIIVNQSENCAGLEDMLETMRNFTSCPIISVPYVEDVGEIDLAGIVSFL